jgi:hypothetical protein
VAKPDHNRANAHANRALGQAKSSVHERDVAAKAVLDNMARLKALRLAREASEPARPAAPLKKTRAKPKKSDEKAPALGDWLAGQQSGGRRT